jgi:lactobin A/cerein 7B family class IIb bacteriocin
MEELKLEEIDCVSGGIVPLVGAAAALGLAIALGIGIYNGYQEAKRGDQKK